MVGASVWGLLKTAGGGSGSQGLCSQQCSSKTSLLRSPEPLVCLPVIGLILRRSSYLNCNGEGPDPRAASVEEMKVSYG